MRLEMHGTQTALMGLTHLIELARSATSGLNGSVQLLSLVGCRAVSAPWVVHRAHSRAALACCYTVLSCVGCPRAAAWPACGAASMGRSLRMCMTARG